MLAKIRMSFIRPDLIWLGPTRDKEVQLGWQEKGKNFFAPFFYVPATQISKHEEGRS